MKMMKKISSTICLFLAFSVCAIAQNDAADAKKNVWKAKISLSGEKSPRISAGSATKKFKIKTWGEIEVEYTPVPVDSASAKQPFVDGVTVEFIVMIVGKEKTLVKDSFTYNSVALKDENFAVAYLSPSTLGRLAGKNDPGVSMIKAYAALIKYGGKVVGFDTKGANGLWWENPKLQADGEESGKMLSHTKTPFGFINFDRYPDVSE